MKLLRASIELVRPGSSLLLFAMLFVPLALHSHDIIASLKWSFPMLLISMCTFIANDLDDIETDEINHPERPLPSNSISPHAAAAMYFVCLGSALLAIRAYIQPRVAFLYFLTITLAISYRYVVAFIPSIKAPYTAGTTAIPAIILAQYKGREPGLYVIALAIFAFALGRELCMDVIDRPGDARSLIQRLNPQAIATTAFTSQIVALLLVLMSLPAPDPRAVAVLGLIAALLLLAAVYWFRLRKHEVATDVMKLQFLLGLYFLI